MTPKAFLRHVRISRLGNPLRALKARLEGLPALILLILTLLYSGLKWWLDRLLIPSSIIYLSYRAYRSDSLLLAGLMVVAAIQWTRSERERKLIEKGGGF